MNIIVQQKIERREISLNESLSRVRAKVVVVVLQSRLLLSICALLVAFNLPDSGNLDTNIVAEIFLELRIISEVEKDLNMHEEWGKNEG